MSLGLQGMCLYVIHSGLKTEGEALQGLTDIFLESNQTSRELNDKILSVSNENVRLTSELTSLRTINEDLNKSLDILTQQHLS